MSWVPQTLQTKMLSYIILLSTQTDGTHQVEEKTSNIKNKKRNKKNYVNINKNKYQKAVKEIKMRWCVFKLDFRLSLSPYFYTFFGVVPWPKYLSSYIIYKHKCGIVCSVYNRITFIVSHGLSKRLDNALYCVEELIFKLAVSDKTIKLKCWVV